MLRTVLSLMAIAGIGIGLSFSSTGMERDRWETSYREDGTIASRNRFEGNESVEHEDYDDQGRLYAWGIATSLTGWHHRYYDPETGQEIMRLDR